MFKHIKISWGLKPIKHTDTFPYSNIYRWANAHGRQELLCNSRVGKFLRNSGRCLNIKLAGRCSSFGSTGGGCCTWLFHIKQKYGIHQHAFLCSNIQQVYFPPSASQMDSRQRIISNACKSLISYIWQAGVVTMSCCHGIQILYLRNSLNFHKNGIRVRIKAW